MPRLERERSLAARVAGCADLHDVRLFGVGANLETPVVEGELSYTLSSDVSYQTLGEPVVRTVIVTGEYEVTVLESNESADDAADEGDDETDKVAEVRFTLAALFSIPELDEDEEPFSVEEYEAFAGTTGQFALYPYAREFVSDVTSRMGLPALHIGALRIELDSRTGE
jgi:Preprotein translocase subunit SecB